MKNIIGKSAGFIIGSGLFTTLFYFVISNLTFFDDDAPGIFVLSVLAFGIVFAVLGSQIQQRYFKGN